MVSIRLARSGDQYFFHRLPGKAATTMLRDASYEPFVDQQFRTASAISISAAIDGCYLIRQSSSGRIYSTSTALLLKTRRKSNPGLAISFCIHNDLNQDSLVSIVAWNEFQSLLGCYDHATEVFYSYLGQNVDEASAIFHAEYGHDLISSLRVSEDKGLLAQCGQQPSDSRRRVIAFGWNRSFGHALWNDLLGYLHYSSRVQSPFKSDWLCGIGPCNWIPTLALCDAPSCAIFDAEDEFNEFTKDEAAIGIWPIGFSITNDYTSFWCSQVSAAATEESVVSARKAAFNHSPIIALGLRLTELWRRSWINRQDQLFSLIQDLLVQYPRAALLIDGMTRYASIQASQTSSEFDPVLISRLSSLLPVIDMSWWPLADKVVMYKTADYSICEFGSGATIPSWVFPIPSICLSGQPELYSAYSSPNCITRSCMPLLQDANVYGHFLPLDHISIAHNGWSMRQPSASKYILDHMSRTINSSHLT